MGKTTEISWTHHTWSPWWGCVKVSPGCEHCYADGMSKRFGYNVWGPAKTTERRVFGDRHWAQPLKWNREALEAGERRRVFPSMCDPFEDHPSLRHERLQLWALIRSTPNLDWLLLTKRPENIMGMIPTDWRTQAPRNVWYGTSVETQEYADSRIPPLMRVPGVVHFLSVEPQLARVDLGRFFWWFNNPGQPSIDWVITGGESGPRHRPFDLDWARLTRDQCAKAGVAWHFKQVGGLHHAAGGCLLDGCEHKEFPAVEAELVPL